MKQSRLWRWLFHRHKQPATVSGISRGASAYIFTASRRDAAFAQDFEDYPEMCKPALSVPTQHITQVIDQGDTLAGWDDWQATRTMETVVLR